MKLFHYFVLIVVFYEVHAGTKRNCGSVLVQIMETICTGSYDKIPTKKSVGNDLDILNMYNSLTDTDSPFSASTFLDDVPMGDHDNNIAKIRRRRQYLGIYHDCCIKGCSLNEISAYCG